MLNFGEIVGIFYKKQAKKGQSATLIHQAPNALGGVKSIITIIYKRE